MQNMKSSIGLIAGLLAAGLAANPTHAHVVLVDGTAAPGAYYTSFFRVGHGCAGSATTALRVEMPEGIVTARPQPKPGWTIAVEHAPLPAPLKGEGGKPVTERVTAITWRGGPLPDDEWDQFGFMAKLPDQPQKLYFPAIQTCEMGESRWVEISAEPGAHLSHPAPMLILAKGGADDMAGMDMGGLAPTSVKDPGDLAGQASSPRPHPSRRPASRGVTIEGAWIAAPPNGAPTAAGYLTVRNSSDTPDTLLGGSSPLVRAVTIHAMSMDGEVMRMRPIPGGLTVPAHGVVVLSQASGHHLMFEGPKRPFKPGDHVPATLRFKTAGEVRVTFQVKPFGGG